MQKHSLPMEFLINLDQQAFNWINRSLSNPLFDWVMPYLTDLYRYWPTYIAFLMILWFWIHKDPKKWKFVILQAVVAVAFADEVSYRLVKNVVERARPEFVLQNVILRTHSHSGFSFPSNHAANSFAVAVTLIFFYPMLWPLFFLLAAAIGFSRIYVGVHFPLDVLAGAAIGSMCSYLVQYFKITFKNKKSKNSSVKQMY